MVIGYAGENRYMKIISITGSARKNGNTRRIAEQLCREINSIADANSIRAEFEQINLSDMEIKICKGCRVCFDKGEELCPLKDDLLTLRDKINQADGIILSSPIYVEDINGIMKNWIDRMAFLCHRPAFFGKAAVIIATSGGGASNHALKTMKSAVLAWGFHVCAQGKFRTGVFMEASKMEACFGNQIKAAAKQLFSALSNKSRNPSFYSLMVFKIQQKYRQKTKSLYNTFDYTWWKEKGWLENTRSYYTPHNSGFIKVKLARLAGSVVSKFFL